MALKIGNEIIKVNKNFELYNKIRSGFSVDAMATAKEFVNIYYECESLDNALQKFIEFVSSMLEERIEKSCALLFQLGVYDISSIDFAQKYYEYVSIDDSMSKITDKLEEICERENELELYSEIKKLGRTQWSGGGFGLGGAISGAITSTALNAAYGMFYAIGDAFRQRSNQNKINRLKMELYNDQETSTTMFWCIHNVCMGVFYGLRDELENHNILEPLEFDSEKASILNENALKYSKSADQKIELLIKSICIDPYNFLLYDPLFSEFSDIEGLKEYASYFCVDKTYSIYMEFERNQRLRTISKTPIENHKQLCLVAKFYNDVSKEYNYDATDEINALSEKFIHFCNSIETIDEALAFFKKQANLEPFQGIITTLESRKTFFIEQERSRQQEAEIKRIKNMPSETIKEIFEKIQELIKFADKYSLDKSQEVLILLKKLKEKCLDITDANAILNGLSKIDNEKYPQSKIMKSAFEIKKKVFDYTEKLKVFDFHIFSPEIIDIVKQARKGNPVAQQWLVDLFCQQKAFDVLRANYLGNSSDKKSTAEECLNRISSVISFVFDSPQKWKFDLFLRIKASFPYLSIDEYIDSLEGFSIEDSCPAGIYEYGKLLYEKKKDNNGISLIKIAANQGYMHAVKFMYDYQKVKNDSTNDLLFYETILPTDMISHTIFRHKPDSEDKLFASNINIIHRLITGEKSYKLNGYIDFSDFVSDIIYDLKSEYSDGKIGYQGDLGDKVQLKAMRMYLSIPNSENSIMSYNYTAQNGEITAVLFTDKNIFWNKGTNNFRKSYLETFSKQEISPTEKFVLDKNVLWQIYMIIYYSCKPYSSNLPTDILEKMAYCGNPLAICNLLSNNRYSLSDDKKDFWILLKKKWEAQGKYFAVCPNCHEVRTKEDMFCPECGAKIY